MMKQRRFTKVGHVKQKCTGRSTTQFWFVVEPFDDLAAYGPQVVEVASDRVGGEAFRDEIGDERTELGGKPEGDDRSRGAGACSASHGTASDWEPAAVETRAEPISLCRKRSFATGGRGRRPDSPAVCCIPCLILCLAYVEVSLRSILVGKRGPYSREGWPRVLWGRGVFSPIRLD